MKDAKKVSRVQAKKRAGRNSNETEALIRQRFFDDLPRRCIESEILKRGEYVSPNTLSKRAKEYRKSLVLYGRCLMEKEVQKSTMRFASDFKKLYAGEKEKFYVYGLKLNSERNLIFERVQIAMRFEIIELQNDAELFLPFFNNHRSISLIIIPELKSIWLNHAVCSNQSKIHELTKMYEDRKSNMGGCKDDKHIFFEETIFRFNNYHRRFQYETEMGHALP